VLATRPVASRKRAIFAEIQWYNRLCSCSLANLPAQKERDRKTVSRDLAAGLTKCNQSVTDGARGALFEPESLAHWRQRSRSTCKDGF